MRYLILAQSECTATALGAWLELLGEGASKDGDDNRIIVEQAQRERDGGLAAYHSTVEQIERFFTHLPIAQHGDMVALVDCLKPSDLSAVSEGMGWDHLVALLILTFPEVRWVFGIVMGDTDDFPLEDHRVASLIAKTRRDPIFDPTGLREWVRRKTNERLKTLHDDGGRAGLALQLPKRRETNLAAAIDDEVDYATMHAYAAYRYGYRADIITTWALMDERFGKIRAKQLPPHASHDYSLLMEDMRLTFADKLGRVHLSELGSKSGKEGRDSHCPLLHCDRDASHWRLLVTSGQMGQDGDLMSDNEAYLGGKKKGTGKVCYKPLGGLCDIWTSTELRNSGEHELDARGNAQGFVWPPDEFIDDLHNGHGSPGKLGMVARVLLERATMARQTATSASDWIGAALLAADAAELLGGKTPTLTLSALALKHEFEVRAECTFIGAGFHFGLDQRLKEIKAEVVSVCRWFHEEKRTQAQRDAMTTIINRLKLVFSEAGQMEEEDCCLIELRSLNRKMGRPKGWRRASPLHWLAHSILAYGEWLLGGFARLITMSVIWIGSIGWVAHHKMANGYPHQTTSTIVGWFFGGNAAADSNTVPFFPEIHYLSWLAVVAGIFHLGILMSYLYSLISRK